jgi:hypothetical protein
MSKLSLEDRFWSKVNRTEPDKCWLWQAASTPNQRKTYFYGHFVWNGKHVKSHRMAYELTFGEIPKGQIVLHRCDVTLCCNPAHLFLGSQQDNMRDMINKGRSKYCKGSKHGMALLNEDKVREIRQAFANGEKQVEIAKRYGVGKHVIYFVVNRKTWNHV